jgi:UDP-glucose 4-epimerase
MGVPEHPVVHHDPRAEVVHAFCDHSKLTRVFGHLPSTPLAEGVGRMVAWARANGPGEPPPPMDIEIAKKLPPAWRD